MSLKLLLRISKLFPFYGCRKIADSLPLCRKIEGSRVCRKFDWLTYMYRNIDAHPSLAPLAKESAMDVSPVRRRRRRRPCRHNVGVAVQDTRGDSDSGGLCRWRDGHGRKLLNRSQAGVGQFGEFRTCQFGKLAKSDKGAIFF